MKTFLGEQKCTIAVSYLCRLGVIPDSLLEILLGEIGFTLQLEHQPICRMYIRILGLYVQCLGQLFLRPLIVAISEVTYRQVQVSLHQLYSSIIGSFTVRCLHKLARRHQQCQQQQQHNSYHAISPAAILLYFSCRRVLSET